MALIIVTVLCLLLTGCSSNLSLNEKLDNIFNANTYYSVRSNNYSTYVDYYLPKDIHEVSSDKTSCVFELENSKLIMNVNLSGVINKENYEIEELNNQGFFDNDKLIYSKQDSYKNVDKSEVNYLYNLYQYDEYYLLYYVSSDICFYGYAKYDDVDLLTIKLFEIAHSCKVNKDLILADFSSTDIIDYQKSTVNLFQTVMPLSGRVDELMVEQSEQLSEE